MELSELELRSISRVEHEVHLSSSSGDLDGVSFTVNDGGSLIDVGIRLKEDSDVFGLRGSPVVEIDG